MSQIRDTLEFQAAALEKFAEHDAEIKKLQRFAAALDQAQKTMDNQVEIFRTAINEQFDRLRRELGVKR